MITRKFVTKEFLSTVKRILIVPEEKKEGYKYLADEVIDKETYFMFFYRKKVYEKGFYTKDSLYIVEQDNFFLRDGVVWAKPYIRIFYKDSTDESQSVYIVAKSNEEVLELFNKFAEKLDLLEYS